MLLATKVKLVAQAKNGDTEAFQTLIHEEKERLYKIAYVYMKNEDDALEVFQETVYIALKSISSLKNKHYFSTWLTRILINQAIDALRKKKKVVAMSHDVLENYTDPATIEQDEQLDLLEAMNEIEEKYKTVLLLRFYEDYTIEQIALFLNCPEGTVKTNIRRGLERLRKNLRGAYFNDRQNSVSQK